MGTGHLRSSPVQSLLFPDGRAPAFISSARVTARYTIDPLDTTYDAKYGLTRTCSRLQVPVGKPAEFECRKFPLKQEDNCKENQYFCAAWTSAGYAVELAIGFGALALVAILIGVSTHSRRRRIWRVVAGVSAFHAAFQLVAFGLIIDLVRTKEYPTFDHSKFGPGLALIGVSWVLSVLATISTITTGLAADRGKRWAAGNRAYQPISG
ncbi:unnamed protein product [Mycena citricolor]|uniref:Uncharacterized protein n=1 Tax=Mycena citricolor TaxID=2018698 RepID=A0AAD2H0D2_9AGAR|nr:unnamed protein product [Mycena citricolor]